MDIANGSNNEDADHEMIGDSECLGGCNDEEEDSDEECDDEECDDEECDEELSDGELHDGDNDGEGYGNVDDEFDEPIMIQRRSISELYMANADHLVEEGLFKGKILVCVQSHVHIIFLSKKNMEGDGVSADITSTRTCNLVVALRTRSPSTRSIALSFNKNSPACPSLESGQTLENFTRHLSPIVSMYYYRYHFCTIGNQSDEGNPHDRQLQAYLQQLAGRFRTVALIYIHEESTLSPGLAFGSRKLEHPLGLLEVENHTFTVSVYDPSAATSPDSPSSR
ncbi:hypothetical protein DFH29DRAFT_877926 [Suillus ampliporus]|nr:hypothetical protein DFH29DRAFT_877926 [Suillus ampliporus]